VAKANPPILVMPKGAHISWSSPLFTAIGSIPIIVVIVVINTGRSLDLPAMTRASYNALAAF